MDHKNDCDHLNCSHANANKSVCQTLSEMDWERGIWNAAFNGDKERVQNLIEKSSNAKEVVVAPDNSGYTALHYAARNGHIDICRLLVQSGADINAQTSGKATPLHKAAAAGQTATMKFLIESGAQVYMQDVDGQTALHKAAENKRSQAVALLLDVSPQVSHVKDFKGRFAINPI